MYSQERPQCDAQTSNIGKQERRDESLNSARSWKQVCEGGGQSLREAEARIPEYADLRFSVFGESLQEHKEKVTLAEDAPLVGIKARNMLIW